MRKQSLAATQRIVYAVCRQFKTQARSLLNSLENFIIGKQRFNPSSPSAFQMIEHHVMPLRGQHANVVCRIVRLVAIAVMYNFTSLEFTLEHFLRQQAMNANGLAVTPRSRVRIAL
jgi:hypothetical protein